MSAPYDELKKLGEDLNKYFKDQITDTRVNSNDKRGRKWFLKSIDYKGKLTLKALRGLTKRSELNAKYLSRYAIKDIKARQGISAIKQEISALYSFNRSATQRYKGRLHHYRDDLSQKGARTTISLAKAINLFSIFKDNQG